VRLPKTLFRPLYRAAALRQGFAAATTNSGHERRADRELCQSQLAETHRLCLPRRACDSDHGQAHSGTLFRSPTRIRLLGWLLNWRTPGSHGSPAFPHDFDGILVGAPVSAFCRYGSTTQGNVISTRRAMCVSIAAGNDKGDCLTVAQAEAIRKVYTSYSPTENRSSPDSNLEARCTHLSPPLP
jgi:hypothetical protein